MTEATADPTPADPTPYVRPDVRGFLDYLNAMPGPRTHQMTPEAARQVFTAMKDVADLPVGELAVIRDLSIPGPGGTIPRGCSTRARPASRGRRWSSTTVAAS